MSRTALAGARAVICRYSRRELSAEVAVVQLIAGCGGVAGATAALAAVEAGESEAGGAGALRDLLERYAEGARVVADVLDAARAALAPRQEDAATDRDPPLASREDRVAATARLFDELAVRSEEASVAAYCLGDPALLARATAEIVRAFEAWRLLGRDRAALEIGCGIGRMQDALAPRLREAHGIDPSPRMIAAARRRCARHRNVALTRSNGRDLSGIETGRFDLVFAVDSFPYLVHAGPDVLDGYVREAARVLRPAGDFVILNFSYRGDLAADARDLRELAARHGFEEISMAERPFALWDGAAFRLRRAPDRGIR